jgi:hypothetical protein
MCRCGISVRSFCRANQSHNAQGKPSPRKAMQMSDSSEDQTALQGSASPPCYAAEISMIDQYLFEVRNSISYCVAVRRLESAVALNRRRLSLQRIRNLLAAQSDCVSS